MARDLVARASIHVDAARERVWDALVRREALREFMFGADVVSDWRPGSPITWRGEWQGKPYEDKGTVLEAAPPRRLRYSHYSPLSGLPDEPSSYHTVTIELAPAEGGTRVALEQENCPSEEARGHYEENWRAMLAGLRKYVEA